MATWHGSETVWMVVHLENLLLLGCKSLVSRLALATLVLLPVHHGKTHRTRHKNIIVLAAAAPVRAFGVVLWIMTRVLLHRLELLVLSLLGVLVAVVGDIPSVGSGAWAISSRAFLVVAVEVLDVE